MESNEALILVPLYSRVLFSLLLLCVATFCLVSHQYTNEAFLLIGSVSTYWLSPSKVSENSSAAQQETVKRE